MREFRIVGYSLYLMAVAIIVAIILLTGCGDNTPSQPPCGPGTFEFRGICLPVETEPPCGPGTHQLGDVCIADNENKCGAGTHWDPEVCEGYGACGKCIANPTTPTPPAKTLVCGPGTLEIAGQCIPDEVPPPKKKTCPFDGNVVGAGCTGNLGVCAVAGVIECLTNGHSICSTDVSGSQSKATIEICDGLDNNCDGLTDEGCPPPATITFTKVQYASDWQVMLGWGGALLAEFEVKGDENEDVLVTELTIADKTQNPSDATTFKNIKLMNIGTISQIAMSPVFNIKANSAYALAKFTGFKLLVPKGQTLKFNVNADVASYDDGGALYTEHRFAILEDTELTAGIQPPATAVSAKTGLPAQIIADAEGASHELVKTKPSVTFAPDSPSGNNSMAGSNLVVAKFVIFNPASAGNYPLKIQEVTPLFVVNGLTLAKGGLVNVYKDSVLLASLTLPTNVSANYSAFMPLGQALEIQSGKSETITVRFTGSVTFGQNPTLRVDLPKNGLTWQWTGGKYYYATDGLPLQGKTLTF